MKKITTVLGFLALVMGFSGTPALAQTTTPKTLTKPTAVKIQLPMMVAGSNQIVDKPVDRDLMMGGGQLKVTAAIKGDAYVAGGQIEFDGSTTGNLIIAGGNIRITGNIGKNLIVAGGQVEVSDKATVGGYVLAAGGQVIMDGTAAGPVKVATGRLTVGDTAKLGGNLEADVGEAQVATQAAIAGEKKVVVHQKPQTPEVPKKALAGLIAFGSMVYLASKLLSILILVAIAKNIVPRAGKAVKDLASSLGWGIVTLIVTPFAIIMLLVTVIGIPLGLILTAVYLVALYLSSLVAAAGIGAYIAERKWVKMSNPYITAVTGLLIVVIIGWIPVLGGLFKFLVLLLGLGTMFKFATNKA